VQQDYSFRDSDRVMVKLRGLPFDLSPDEIVNFFRSYQIISDSVIIEEKSDGKRTG